MYSDPQKSLVVDTNHRADQAVQAASQLLAEASALLREEAAASSATMDAIKELNDDIQGVIRKYPAQSMVLGMLAGALIAANVNQRTRYASLEQK